MDDPFDREWVGPHPLCLMILVGGGDPVIEQQTIDGRVMDVVVGWTKPGISILDLDEKDWKKTYDWIFSTPAHWYLIRKSDRQAVLSMVVLEGDQPYYVKRIIGNARGPLAGRETYAFGIGKKAKRLRGKGTKKRWVWNEDNLWWFPWGQTCGGTDVEIFALEGMKKGFDLRG